MVFLRWLPFGQAGDRLEAGILVTRAGTGERGYTGDGGPALKATLSEPFHCDVDKRGNLYIAEAMNPCIRKDDLKTGAISTVAGSGTKDYSGDRGKATDATFTKPDADAVDTN